MVLCGEPVRLLGTYNSGTLNGVFSKQNRNFSVIVIVYLLLTYFGVV